MNEKKTSGERERRKNNHREHHYLITFTYISICLKLGWITCYIYLIDFINIERLILNIIILKRITIKFSSLLVGVIDYQTNKNKLRLRKRMIDERSLCTINVFRCCKLWKKNISQKKIN